MSKFENNYLLKYGRLKEKYMNKISAATSIKYDYVFENESYVKKLKSLEFEIPTVEYLYNLYFYPFNVDSWFKKLVNTLITRSVDDILKHFTKVQLTEAKNDDSLAYIQNIRDYVIWNLKVGNEIKLYGNSLSQSYVLTINKSVVKLINKYHKESGIQINNDDIILLDLVLTKHLLVQFVTNPFWYTSSLILDTRYEQYNNYIITENWENIKVDDDVFIDGRCFDVESNIIAEFINPRLQSDLVNLDKDIITPLFLIMCLDDVTPYLKSKIWSVIKKLKNTIKSNTKNVNLISSSTFQKQNTKNIIWSEVKPQFSTQILENKRNLLTKEELISIQGTPLIELDPNDLAWVLPLILSGKEKLIDVVPYFFTTNSELPKDELLTKLLTSQLPFILSKHFLSPYCIDYLLKSDNETVVLKQAVLWNESLWNLNYCLMNSGHQDIFYYLNKLPFKVVSDIANFNFEKEIKIALLVLGRNDELLGYYLDSNPQYLVDIFMRKKNYSFKKRETNIKEGILELSQEIEFSKISLHTLYSSYLLNIVDKETENPKYHYGDFREYKNELFVLTKHLKDSFISYDILVTDTHIYLTNLERRPETSLWNIILINNRLPNISTIKVYFYLKECSFSLQSSTIQWSTITEDKEKIVISVDEHSVKTVLSHLTYSLDEIV